MSITIHILYSGEGTHARDCAREMVDSGLVEAIRAQPGNLRYEYFLPLDREDAVLLIDSWTDQAALDRHHASPMMGKLLELREKHGLHMTVERLLSDDGGIPAGDRAFIRE